MRTLAVLVALLALTAGAAAFDDPADTWSPGPPDGEVRRHVLRLRYQYGAVLPTNEFFTGEKQDRRGHRPFPGRQRGVGLADRRLAALPPPLQLPELRPGPLRRGLQQRRRDRPAHVALRLVHLAGEALERALAPGDQPRPSA